MSANALKQLIREVPDFPKPGINFYDITTLLKDKAGFRETVDALGEHYRKAPPVDIVVGIEARGYFFAPAMAHALGAGFVPVRKPKKLPYTVRSIEYALEYGTDQLEMHADAIEPGQNVLLSTTFWRPAAPLQRLPGWSSCSAGRSRVWVSSSNSASLMAVKSCKATMSSRFTAVLNRSVICQAEPRPTGPAPTHRRLP